jgi:uncharacterized protein YjbI with pentapeptide repeats
LSSRQNRVRLNDDPVHNNFRQGDKVTGANLTDAEVNIADMIRTGLTGAKIKQVIELLQKPFSSRVLLDTISDKQIYNQLKKYTIDILLKRAELSH